MNTVLGAAVAALSTNKSVLSIAAIGLSTGGALFFGGPKVEDLSHQVADACFSKDTSLHTVAKRVVSVTLVAFATFAVVNLGASTLAFSWTAPLSLLGAVVGSATYHILSGVPEVPSVEEKVDASELKGICIGHLSQDGRRLSISNSQGDRQALSLLDSSGSALEQAIPCDQKAKIFKVIDGDGRISDVIVENRVVYAMKTAQPLGNRVGWINDEGKAVIHVCDEGFIFFNLWTIGGKLLTKPPTQSREVPLKICRLDGSLQDVVLLAGEVYQKEFGKPFYFGEKLGVINADSVSATLGNGSVCQVRNASGNVATTLGIKDNIICPRLLGINEKTIKAYYLDGVFYERLPVTGNR